MSGRRLLSDLLSRIERAGIRLWLDGDRLRYDAPEGAMTAALRDELRAGRHELIEHLRRTAADGPDRPPLVPRATSQDPPLSFAQERLWVIDRMGAGAAYNMRLAERLAGPLDVTALRRALEVIVGRHEILRTTFPALDGRPVQRIAPSIELPFEAIDLGHPDPAERDREFRRRIADEVVGTFDLARGPLFRVRLYRLEDHDHVLVVTLHHIVFDAWSVGVFKRELSTAYRAIVTGATPVLDSLPVQYADFAVWQRSWLKDDALGALLDYWSECLRDAPVVELPSDRARPAVPSFEGADLRFEVSPDLYAGIVALGQDRGATPAMGFLAAYAALLARYTGGAEVVVGSPIANRTTAEVEGLLGLFVNTVVLRTDMSGDPSFDDILDRVRQVSLGAYDNQDMPFERLVDDLIPERDASRNPLFQITFAFQNAPAENLVLPGVTAEPFDLGVVTTRFDLELYLHFCDGGLQGRLVYNTDLFEHATAQRLERHYLHLLRAIIRQPGKRLSLLPVLESEERRRLLLAWNDTRTAYPRDKTVDRLFEEQVARTPDTVAVSYDGSALTYDALNRRANQLARYLEMRGVGRGSLVAICMERSTDFIVGLVGILKAGAAYVPLDADYPKKRLAVMLDDADAPVLLTHERTLDALPEYSGDTILLDRDGLAIAQENEEGVSRDGSAEDLAYVIYTSGSTGTPKGVCVPHRGISRLVLETDYCQVELSDRVAQASNASFDAATFEIWGGLLNGARVIGISNDVSLSARRFAEALRDQRITTLFLTTALFNQLSLEVPDIFETLRHLMFGGERVDPGRVRAVLEQGRPQRLLHVYGPTECTTFSSWYEVRDVPEQALTVPIGRPIANSTMYVLDRKMRLVPAGAPGDLYLGGDGLAVGYHERPELTAESFIPDPFSGTPAARLYGTGDVVRYRPDGAIEFLGRNDHQVKLRGFRIELGEIETVLNRLEEVSASVVTVHQGRDGDRHLVAYVVPAIAIDDTAELDRESEDRVDDWQNVYDGAIHEDEPCARKDFEFNTVGWTATNTGEPLDPGAMREQVDQLSRLVPRLRQHIEDHLPEHMIPRAFVLMDALPLTPNGKVDRKALPEPDRLRRELTTMYEVPRTAVEQELCEIWSDLLGSERIGIHDDFFELGGHSLLATQVMTRIRQRYGCELPIRDLFDNRTIAGLAGVVQGAAVETIKAAPIEPIPRDGDLPLSFAQQRLWFLDQLHPGTSAYNNAIAVRLRGPLDATALRRGLDEVVRRHETLRTAFRSEEGVPRQVVMDPAPAELKVVDLTDASSETRESTAQRFAREELERPFDLAAGQPIRVRLIRLSAEDHVLLSTFHHIVVDGWSLRIFHRELAALYESVVRGETAQLPDLEIQYADFAAWQRQWLSGAVWEEQADYWRTRLADVAPMEIPIDRPRPARQTFVAARETLEPSKSLADSIDELGRQLNATPFMTLLAAANVLLQRYSGQDDIIVGSPVANRNRIETEHLIGFFVNSLVMRTDVSGNPTFRELVQRVRKVALGAYQHQDIPFEHLVEELRPERDLSRNPIFQILFGVHESGMLDLELPGVNSTRFEQGQDTTRLDLEVHIFRSAEGMTVQFVYSTALFEATTIEFMARHFRRLLEDVVANPDRSIAELQILDDGERRILDEWNDVETSYVVESCLHEMFEQQVELNPDAVAVVFEDERIAYGQLRLTYGELNRRSNRLAHHLRSRGVGSDTLVGLAVERGPDMLVGILGILKAGGAYVPVDATNPTERIAFILEDTSVAALVTETGAMERLPEFGGDVVLLDVDHAVLERYSDCNPVPVTDPENLAYVIYTSGSTGKPKGVAIEHGMVARLFEATEAWFGFDDGDVWTLFHSFAFDFSVWEIWGALLYGGRLVVVPYVVSRSPEEFRALLGREHVTVLNQTPSAFRQLVQADQAVGEPGNLSLRLVIFGGEALDPEILRPWFERHGDQRPRLVNMYGITETTVHVTYHPLGLRDLEPTSGSVIGRPIPDLQLYILDPDGRPSPIGVPGEMYVGGGGVARGYLNRPQLTAERFIEDRFGGRSGSRLYRTGDVARYRPDGDIVYMGRNDDQVKIRGHRIELGEIESTAVGHPAVDQAVAMVREDHPGDPRLVLYIVSADSRGFSAFGFREYLKVRLPSYMVPHTVVPLQSVPLTPNGKVDRRALPVPDMLVHVAKAPPETPVQTLIAEEWRDLLGITEIGLEDDFFDLGGHSLLGMRLVTRMRQVFDIDIPLSALFEAPTLAGLAERVETLRGTDNRSASPGIVPLPRDGGVPLALSFGQQRLWFLDQVGAGTGYTMPFALRMIGDLDVAELQRSVDAMVHRHEVLRTVFPTEDGKPRLEILPTLEMPIRVVDRSDDPDAERESTVNRIVVEDTQRPFDLRDGPLMRATLIRLGDRDHVLLLTFHHIVGDGWSFGIFCREMVAFYEAFGRGETPDMSEPVVQYADLAAWQREALRGGLLERQLEYWCRTLESLPVFSLPTDRPRPSVQTFNGAARSFEVSEPVAGSLRNLGRQAGVTPAMVLLAAYVVLLARYAGLEDVVVGLPVAGRTHSDVEAMIGLFVNTLVMRADLSGNPSFLEVLEQVRRVSLDAYDHQELPFERLVEELNPTRDTSRNPLFQVGFTLQNLPRVEFELPYLSIRPEPIEVTTARIDLELYLVERGDGLVGRMVYNTDLFDGETIDRMSRNFMRLLDSIVQQPSAPISDLALIEDGEVRKIVVDWNDTGTPFADGTCIHELIEARACEAPDATAVVSERGELTYGELNAEANRLAHTLRAMGVGPDDVVGLCAERGPDMMAGLLGILKAGGAYLPLDPDYPVRRLEFMLEDSGVPILLTQENLLAKLSGTDARTLCLDRNRGLFGDAPATNPVPLAAADNLAYVIYTSGSTGTPKGTWLCHRGLCSLSEQQSRAFGVGPESRVLQFSSLSFDASTFEIVMALPKGAALILGTSETLLPGPDLLGFLRRHRVSIVTVPPTALAATPVEPLPDLKTITVAGEACPADVVRKWGTGRRFFNLYGPTEATIWSTMARLEANIETVHIGRPIGNVQAYIVDGQLRPVPVGVVGELYVAGIGLARGYLDRPGLTAERFIPNPFSEHPGARMYRTGDVARFRADGNIEFAGRIDYQVKVRGYRIELGEVEAALARCPGVRTAFVMCREDRPRDRRLVAYVVGDDDHEPSPAELRRALAEHLPGYMVPAAFVGLDQLPVTLSGKVDRDSLPAPGDEAQHGEDHIEPRSGMEKRIAAIWSDILGVKGVGTRDSFFELGGHSLQLVQLRSKLATELDREIPMTALFRYPTVAALAEHLGGGTPPGAARGFVAAAGKPSRVVDDAIAVIAQGGRFPDAPTVEQFWSNLCDGVESIRFFTEQELRKAGVDGSVLADPDFVGARAVVDDADRFDAWLFGFTPREAERIDPQHRVFLECAWEVLERAGYDPERYDGLIGVYAGSSANGYLENVQSHPEILASGAGLEAMVSSGSDFLATRASFKLDLRGPSFTVQTACSTSLVAVHVACDALLGHRCDLALAGGVSVSVPLVGGHLYREGGIGSPDGHCRPFDARAGGTLRGDGAGIVVLKRLSEALRDGDEIHAVILGTAINNDGSTKVGYTAPSVEGQARVIATALSATGVDPDTITYVEAHGTATPLGDTIEVAALAEVFGAGNDRHQPCALGSVKSNIGHLDAAAGIAGFIKTVLALEHRRLPPSLHYERPNPEIDFANTPFEVVTDCRDWVIAGGGKRRAGVSSFGIGGTNAHVVLEEAPSRRPSGPSRSWQILTISAKSEDALDVMTRDLASHLREHGSVNLADVAHTLQVGRRELDLRRAVVCRSVEDAVSALANPAPRSAPPRRVRSRKPPVVFMFPGQGAQYVDMGLELAREEPVFRSALDDCFRVLQDRCALDLRAMLYPEGGATPKASYRLNQTSMAQPALFVIEYALARLWRSWGLEPEACIGHSIGEYVAACIGGVFALEDALSLVTARGRLMAEMPTGAMTAVPLEEDRLHEALAEDADLWLSAVNGPSMCVASGPLDRVEALEHRLLDQGVECRRLHTSHAFHSGLMDGALEPFLREVQGVKREAPRIPFVSNLTGDWITAELAQDPEYWARQLRETVRFGDGMARVLEDDDRVLLEVGPGRVLGALARQQPACGRERVVAASLPAASSEESDVAVVTEVLGRLWTTGVGIDWSAYRGEERRRRVTLPTYPFQRRRYWIDRRRPAESTESRGRRNDIADWFYVPTWRRSRWAIGPDATNSHTTTDTGILVFAGDADFDRHVVRSLEASERPVTVVHAGESFQAENRRYRIRASSPADYRRLVASLVQSGGFPGEIVHLWGRNFERQRPADEAGMERIQDAGFYSLLALARAMGGIELTAPVRMSVVTDGVHEVVDGDVIIPEKATIMGPCRVIPHEFPSVTCRNIDLAARHLDGNSLEMLVKELLSSAGDTVVAHRRGQRWIQSVVPVRLDAVESTLPGRLRPEGTYLITGGLGGMGLEIAAYLARTARAKLVLVGRTGLPQREKWLSHVDAHGDAVSQKIRRIQAMEAAGAEVMIAEADVGELSRMTAVVSRAKKRFGPIHGVFHAAGIPGGGIMLHMERRHAARVMAPKVTGTRVLEHLFANDNIDLMVLFSSLITAWGLPGRVEYVAANAYLDAFARRFAADTDTFTVAVNWPTWRETGMAVDAALEQGKTVGASGISNRDGIEVLRRVLDGCDEAQILVSEVDLRYGLSSPLDTPSGRADPTDGDAAASEVGSLYRRPELSTAFVAPRDETERVLAGVWQSLFGIDRIGIDDNFFELGGDSVMALQIVASGRQAGLVFSVRDVLQHQTVAEVASSCSGAVAPYAEQGPVVGPVPLVPLQRWFFDQDSVDPHHFNLAMLLEADVPLDPDRLADSLDAVLWHHDALRLRFRHVGNEWQAEIAPPGDRFSLEIIDLPESAPDRVAALVERHAGRIQGSLNLADGPIARAALFREAGQEPDRLLLVVHHGAFDAVSWRILLDDLARGLRQPDRGRTAPLPRKTSSVLEWARHLAAAAKSESIRASVDTWLELPWGDAGVLPVDRSDGQNTFGSAVHITTTIPADRTEALLRRVPGTIDATVDAVLLAALGQTLVGWAGSPIVADVEGLGREGLNRGIDVTRTIGWFTAVYPLLLDCEDAERPVALLARVLDRLKSFRNQEHDFALARYASREGSAAGRLRSLPRAQVSFLYLGHLDQVTGRDTPFRLSGMPTGPARSPVAQRFHLLDVQGSVLDGHLRMRWTYSRDIHDDTTIRDLAERFLVHLDQLVTEAETSREDTPARDTDRYGWSDDDFEDILRDVEKLQE